jgi:hypothetical protein
MINSDGTPVVSKKIHVAVQMQYVEYDAQSASGTPDIDTTGTPITKGNTVEHHADIEVTNGTTQSYSTLASTTPGEAYIIGNGGIAQYLYEHLNKLQYEGNYAKVEVAFGTVLTLRNAINFSGGATSWATMDAQPQGIRRHYGKKTTEIQIGVSKWLTAEELSVILNMWRYRRTWYNPNLRTQNNLSDSSNIDQAIATGNANSPGGLKNPLQNGIFSYTTQPSGTTPGVIAGGIVQNPALVTVHDAFN